MAIENIFMIHNTSVIADDVLSHRLGLIPLDVDPRLFEYIAHIYCSSFTFIHHESFYSSFLIVQRMMSQMNCTEKYG
jgi:DNA-directed RNA polymerase alpha subunit